MRRRSPDARTTPPAANTASPDAARGREAEPDPEAVGIDGYRVIRTLGVGSRARVYLAHADNTRTAVVIKAFAPEVSDDSVETEVAAYEAVQSLHVVRLLDLSFGAQVPRCAVLERLDGGTVAALLRARDRIRPGEGVTILVSVFRGIRALHQAGFAHGAVNLSTVLFDRAGRPVLIGLGHAVRLAPPGSEEYRANVGRDWERYRALALAVLERIDGESRASELERIERMVDDLASGHGADTVDGFEAALFALDQAAPVRLGQVSGVLAAQRGFDSSSRRLQAAGVVVGTTAWPAEPRQDPASEGPDSERRTARRVHARRTALPAASHAALPGDRRDSFANRLEAVWDAGPLRAVARQFTPFVLAHKKPLIVAGAIAGVFAIAGLAAIPPGSVTSPPTASAQTHNSASPAAQHASNGSTAPTHDPSSSPSPSAMIAVAADDPVDAVTMLLAERAHCFAKASEACFNAVDQADSVQLDTDRAAVQSRAGATARESLTDYSTFAVSLIQRTGNSALVELTPPNGQSRPASALVIKGEAGWRLRQIFED